MPSHLLRTCLLAGLLTLTPSTLRGQTVPAPPNPFYAMDTNLRDGQPRTPEQTARLLHDLGYDGYGHGGTQNIDTWLEALDREGLTLFNTYVGLDLDDGGRIDPALLSAAEKLKGRSAMLWLYVVGSRSDRVQHTGDAVAVKAIQALADHAHSFDVRIALYPHAGFYVETVDDALRIARQVNRRNVGVTLNLCHWLKVEGPEDLSGLITRALPYLLQVSINGADTGDTRSMGWDRLIQPLDQGTYDVDAFLNTLRQRGYHGPVGLQGYGIGGSSDENLERSLKAWRKMSPAPITP